MHRRKLLSWLPTVAAALAVAAVGSGCGGSGGEQQVLKKYFDASRLRDQTTLANIATVSFRPQEEGIVQSFSIETISPEQPRTLRIKELTDAYEQAKAEDDEFSKRKKAYQDENLEAIDRVLRAERDGTKLRGKDLEVQQEWSKWREEMADHAKKVSEAQQAASDEKSIAELSVFNAANPIDVGQYEGQLITKDVVINAKVRTPDEQTVDKKLDVIMSRAELKGPTGDVRNGRWIITSIKEAGT
jgi:hypothetical protein